MTLFEAEKIVKTQKLQFGDETQIQAVTLISAAEEIVSLLKTHAVECPTCEGEGDVECGECNGTGRVNCDHCDHGELVEPSKFTTDYAVFELLGKVQKSIHQAVVLPTESSCKQESFFAA